jgi:cobalt-zinc-cadmium efflux system protein
MSLPQRHEEHHDHDHGHDHHDHDHGYHHAQAGGKRGLLMALAITLVMMVAEAIGGLLSNSLALLSDAGHMLTDALALGLSFFAMKFATMPATERKTFGFYRLEILAALANGTVLLLVSLTIMYQAYGRLLNPQPVEGTLMLGIAGLGLLVNVAGALFLMKFRETNLNIRGAFLHIIGDALSSVGVIIGGIIILYTGWYLIDPILSIVIAVAIIIGAGALVFESVGILLESVPSHINLAAVAEAISGIKGVREAYHIHVWTITSGVYALSAHVLIDDQLVSLSREVLDEIRSLLSRKFKILHSTIQLECEKCDLGQTCSLPVQAGKNRAGAS